MRKNNLVLNILQNAADRIEKSIPGMSIALIPLLAIFVAVVSTLYVPLTAGKEINHMGSMMAPIILWGTTIMLTISSSSVPISILNAIKDSKVTVAEILRTCIYLAFSILIIFFILGPKLYTIFITSPGLQDYIPGGFTLDLWIQAVKCNVSSMFHCTDNIRNMTSVEQLNNFIAAEKAKGIIYIDRDQFNKIILFEYCSLALAMDMIWGILSTLLGITKLDILEKTVVGNKTINQKINAKAYANVLEWLDIITATTYVVDWSQVASNLVPSKIMTNRLGTNDDDINKFVGEFERFISSTIITNANKDVSKDRPSKSEFAKAIASNGNINNAVRSFINSINSKYGVNIKK